MKLTVLVFAIAFFFLVPAQTVSGQCACAGKRQPDGEYSRYADAYEELVASDAVFVGEVISVKEGSEKSGNRGTVSYEETAYRVEQGWKGVKHDTVTVRMQSYGCTLGLKPGVKMLIFASLIDGFYWNGCCCTRNAGVERAGGYLELFVKKGLTPFTPNRKKTN
jgi:hypothetical protein